MEATEASQGNSEYHESSDYGRVREAVLSTQLRDLERRHSRFEDKLLKEIGHLRSDITMRTDALEAQFRTEIEAMTARLTRESQDRQGADKQLSDEAHVVKTGLAKELESLRQSVCRKRAGAAPSGSRQRQEADRRCAAAPRRAARGIDGGGAHARGRQGCSDRSRGDVQRGGGAAQCAGQRGRQGGAVMFGDDEDDAFAVATVPSPGEAEDTLTTMWSLVMRGATDWSQRLEGRVAGIEAMGARLRRTASFSAEAGACPCCLRQGRSLRPR